MNLKEGNFFVNFYMKPLCIPSTQILVHFWMVTVEMPGATHAGLHVKSLLLMLDFNQNWNVST
jgi:hypothetical protein